MARYMIISKGAPLDKIEKELVRCGATNIVKHIHVGQIAADLDSDSLNRLYANPGILIKPVKEIGLTDVNATIIKAAPLEQIVATLQQDVVTQAFSELRNLYTPPLTGVGLTVAVLDTGIRKTHNALRDKVVYEYNATSSPTMSDVYGHGTGVASIICGEDLSAYHIGVSPGSKVMNIKVMGDNGVATTESIVAGIEHVISLVDNCRRAGIGPMDPMYPNVINLSMGGTDTGDVDEPMLIAARSAVRDWDIDVIAAAGNFGPGRTTITIPATDPLVFAVGGVETGSLYVWEKSSRGPTQLGNTKPDFMAWATDITVATHRNDTEYDIKSGTSFSTPIICALSGILWETTRLTLSPLFAPQYVFRWGQIVPYARNYCVKPVDAAIIKDNIYGYGTPIGGAIIQQLMGGTGSSQQLIQTLPMLMMMAMLSAM